MRHKRAWIAWAHFVLFPRKAPCYTITTWPRASPQWKQKPFSAHHLKKCPTSGFCVMCGQGFKNSCNCSSRSFTRWAQLATFVRGTGTFKNYLIMHWLLDSRFASPQPTTTIQVAVKKIQRRGQPRTWTEMTWTSLKVEFWWCCDSAFNVKVNEKGSAFVMGEFPQLILKFFPPDPG